MSDRIEKEAPSEAVVVGLEKGGRPVVKYDWRKHICVYLQQGKQMANWFVQTVLIMSI